MNLPKNKLTNEKIDEILKDYRNVLTQQMGLILNGKHRLDIKTADKMLIDEPKQKLATLIHQAEIKARIDELEKINYFIVKHSSSLLLPPPSDIKNNINERKLALEKEIV